MSLVGKIDILLGASTKGFSKGSADVRSELGLLKRDFGEFSATSASFAKQFGKEFLVLGAEIGKAFAPLGQAFSEVGTELSKLGEKATKPLAPFVSSVSEAGKKAAASLFAPLKSAFETSSAFAQKSGKQVKANLLSAFSSGASLGAKFFSPFIGAFKKIETSAFSVGKRLFTPFAPLASSFGKLGLAGSESFAKIAQAAGRSAQNLAPPLFKVFGTVGKLAGTLASTAVSAFGKILGMGLSLGSSLSKAFLGVGASIVKAFSFGALAVGGLGVYLVSCVKDLQQLGMKAERAGTSVDALKGLQLAASSTGTSIEGITELVGGLNATLASASTGDTAATFALQGLGLSARDLIQLRPEEALGKISDGLVAIENPGQRAAIITQLFGESALKLSRVLALGSTELAAYQAQSTKLNGSISGFDSKKIDQANASFALLGASVEAIKTRLTVALAPTVAAIAGQLGQLAQSGVSSFGSLESASELFSHSIGYIADGVEVVKLSFLGLQAIVTRVFAFAAKTVGLLSKGLDTLANGGKASSATQFLDAYSKELDQVVTDQSKKLNEVWLQKPPSNAIKSFYDDIALSAKKANAEMAKAAGGPNAMGEGLALGEISQKVREFSRELDVSNAKLGRSFDFGKLYDLKAHGASDKQLSEASGKVFDNSIKEDVIGFVRDSLSKGLTPLQKAGQMLNHATYLFRNGQLSQNDYDLAKIGAQREVLDAQEQSLGSTETKFAGAAGAGSAEVRSAILQATSSGTMDIARTGIEYARRQLDQLTNIARSLDRAANATPPAVVVAQI